MRTNLVAGYSVCVCAVVFTVGQYTARSREPSRSSTTELVGGLMWSGGDGSTSVN
jgi:hypothetical protein